VPGTARSTGSDRPVDRRPNRPRLTRREVLATALRLIDEEGVDALTMRRLGRALDRDPMRLYRFAASKDELLDGVVELVLEELEVPSSAPAQTWSDVLRATAHRYRRIAVRHPHVVPLLVTRPLATPLGLRPLGTLRPLEALLELLVAAGFAPHGALHAYRLYMGFLQGHVLTELQERVTTPTRPTRCSASASTGCRPASSRGCAPSPPR